MKQHRSGKEKHTEKAHTTSREMYIKSYCSCVCVCACPFLQSSRPTNKDYIKILLSPPFPLPACACACVHSACVSCGGAVSCFCGVLYILPAVRPGVDCAEVPLPPSCVCVCALWCNGVVICVCVGVCLCWDISAVRPVVHYTEASLLSLLAVSVRRAPHTGQ